MNVFVFIAFGILPIAYFNIFGDLMAGLAKDAFKLDKENFFATKLPWILFDGLCLVYLILKKQMAELKIASLILFAGVLVFLVCIIS